MTAKADFSARPFSMRGEWEGKEDMFMKMVIIMKVIGKII